MVKRFPFLPWCAAFLVISASCLSAEAPPSAKPPAETVSLEEIPKRIAKLEEEVARAMAAAQTAVEEEAQAERISAAVAQSLRWSFRPTTIGTGVDMRGVISTAPVPADNARLTAVTKELETASQRLQSGRVDLYNRARSEIKQRVTEAVRSAANPEEVSNLLDTLQPLENGLKGQSGSSNYELPNLIYSANNVLGMLKRLLTAQKAANFALVGRELGALRQQLLSSREFANGGEVDARQAALVALAQKESDQTREALDAALRARKSAREATPLLAKHLDALERLDDLRPATVRGFETQRDRAAKGFAQVIVMLTRLEKGLMITESEVREWERSLDWLGPKLAPLYAEMMMTWQRESAAVAGKRSQERTASIGARLAAAQKPGDLDLIADDLAAEERDGSRGSVHGAENIALYAAYLKALALCWANPTPALVQQSHELETQAAGSRFALQTVKLKERVERDVLSQMLHLPELKTAPLNNRPAEAAIVTLSDELAAKGEWRRLYDLLREHTPSKREQFRGREGSREDDAVSALRAYFAAQNMELAEQWTEAAQLYQQVLRNASARAPVKPAAERLKAIRKEHPEALKGPQ